MRVAGVWDRGGARLSSHTRWHPQAAPQAHLWTRLWSSGTTYSVGCISAGVYKRLICCQKWSVVCRVAVGRILIILLTGGERRHPHAWQGPSNDRLRLLPSRLCYELPGAGGTHDSRRLCACQKCCKQCAIYCPTLCNAVLLDGPARIRRQSDSKPGSGAGLDCAKAALSRGSSRGQVSGRHTPRDPDQECRLYGHGEGVLVMVPGRVLSVVDGHQQPRCTRAWGSHK